MAGKYIPKSFITVELWEGDKKLFAHPVKSLDDVAAKVAQFRVIAINNQYKCWRTFIVRPVFIPGAISNCSRKLSRTMQDAWNKWEKKNGIKYKI